MGPEQPLTPLPSRRIGSQVEYDLLCPPGGIERGFRELIDADSATRYIDMVMLVPDPTPRHRVHIRLHQVRADQDRARPLVFHIRNGYYYETDADGNPLHDIQFDDLGEPAPGTPGVYRCNGHVNLEVTQFDTKLGAIRAKRRM